jgi:hypothetical protein
MCYQEESPPPQALLAQIVDCFQMKSDAVEFLAGPFEHYQEESSPPWAITQFLMSLSNYNISHLNLSGAQCQSLMILMVL